MLKMLTVNLDRERVADLDRIATEKQVSRGAVIRWAVDHYLQSISLPACPIDGTKSLIEDTQPAEPVNA